TPPMELLVKFVKSISKEKYVDKNRIYVGGLSMGGMGTFELLYRLPKVFAAAFPICGGSSPDVAKKYAKKVKLWIFHGEMDEVVSVEYSKQMHKAILSNGGEAKLTLYPFVNHNSWENAFGEPDLMPWLFSIKK
ncbi:MAG TPA: prolyl oligopeptidase family serine peptidase, partial [Tenuifilaceae bacterium]|nr:prolyl oligopeptidase family serine peptidase [Tenuifilaceae bacterium]